MREACDGVTAWRAVRGVSVAPCCVLVVGGSSVMTAQDTLPTAQAQLPPAADHSILAALQPIPLIRS